jgi:hypothetical protein
MEELQRPELVAIGRLQKLGAHPQLLLQATLVLLVLVLRHVAGGIASQVAEGRQHNRRILSPRFASHTPPPARAAPGCGKAVKPFPSLESIARQA